MFIEPLWTLINEIFLKFENDVKKNSWEMKTKEIFYWIVN